MGFNTTKAINKVVNAVKRQILTLFLTLLILMSIGGVVSTVGAASHVTPEHVAKPTVKAASCDFVGSSKSNVYHYPGCSEVKHIKPENLVCFSSPSDACAYGHTKPCKVCNPPPC